MTKIPAAVLTAVLLIATSCSTSVDINADDLPDPVRAATPTLAPEPTPTEPPTPTPTLPPTPTPTPLPPGMITVTDTDAVGVLGDGAISLVEAVQLANGRLTVGELSEAESALVAGAPGATNTDTITVEVPAETPIVFPGGNVWIVELFNNGGDTLLGGGVTLTGASFEPGVSHNAMLIGSSDVIITGFVFERMTSAISIESAGRQLGDVAIVGNTFRNTAVRDVTVLNSLTAGSLSGVRITGNTFEAPERISDLRAFVTVRGGEGLGEAPTEDTTIENLVLADNTMSAPGGSVGVCISIAGGHVSTGQPGQVRGATVTGVEVSGNTITGCTTAIDITGGLVEQTNGTVNTSSVTDVTIVGSTLNVGTTAIRVHGGRVAPAPPSFGVSGPTAATVDGNVVEGVAIDTSVLSAFDVGVRLVGAAFDVEGNGSATANAVNAVTGTALTLDGLGSVCVATVDVGPNAADNTIGATCDEVSGS